MEKFIYQNSPIVTFATNKFINVPVILQFDETPLISIVREEILGFTTEIPIFHADGTYLAKVRGTRIFPTKDGEKSGLEITHRPQITVCTIGKRTVFEIFHEKGDAFRTKAELYTPNGCFVRAADTPIQEFVSASGQAQALKVGGIVMIRCVIQDKRIGVWLRSNGSCAIGVS
ncbi:MAG: hypothetical protein ACYC37_03665 [Desulfobacteria bacterium]